MLLCIEIAILTMVVSEIPATGVNKQYGRDTLLALRPPVTTPPSDSIINGLKRLEQVYISRDALQEDLQTHCKRRRGRRGGIRARLRRRGLRTPLPIVTFGNVRSIRNKIDELSANCKYLREYRESAVIAITETWLQDRDSDGTVTIDGFTLIRSDRRNTDKERGGGIAVYINNKWCTQVTVNESFCNKDIELLVISCRPFYLPREFGKVTIFIVYIPPDSDEGQAKELLENCVSKHENEDPEGIRIILGDFNHCDFQDSVPTYKQTVKCTTRGNNILDKMYCNIKNSYRVVKKPP